MTYKKLVIMETDNGYIVEYNRQENPIKKVAYICKHLEEVIKYIEKCFERKKS